MHLDRRVRLQLSIFAVIAVISGAIMGLTFMDVPSRFFGVGDYRVTVELPSSGGLYVNANVTYRGVDVGRVTEVRLSGGGVDAIVDLKSDVPIPADLDAAVHSRNAVGEQYMELLPRKSDGPTLENGSVITLDRTTVPPALNRLLDATNRGLQAIPNDNLKTAIDESYTAFGGLGPELSRIIKSASTLSSDARKNLESITTLIDQSPALLQTQIDTSDSIGAWAANVADITGQLAAEDDSVRAILDTGPAAADEVRALLDRVQPTLPVLLSNLVSLGDVALTYQPNLEQLLVLLPPGVEVLQGAGLANRGTKQDYNGFFLSFNLNVNVPPPCSTGYLPATQHRPPAAVDYPDRPQGDLYCRVPQDSMIAVRGARNLPCATKPGKRAPTAAMCASEENYVPLNDGFNWKGDPNATLSGQAVPQPPPGTPGSTAPPPPVAVAEYDPLTGGYIGPDGKRYTQTNLAQSAQDRSWQDMLLPPKGP
jgi:phospholipid/cholesterol/gamma-HCH transport system substrate-binding protein